MLPTRRNVFLGLVVTSGLLCLARCATFSEDRLKALAEKLGSRLYRVAKEATGVELIEKGFSDLKTKFEENDPAETVTSAAQKISKSIHQKIVSIERLVEVAEEAARTYRWNDHIHISYHNAKEPDSNATGFEPIELRRDPRFPNDAGVNLHHSTVHVPTNVYSHAINVQNGVEWSKRLDVSFRDVLNKDPTIRSQSFCSTTGFNRMFPGVRWPHFPEVSREADRSELYDCRLTNWFIRAASSPKDMVILLDISGSMTGLRRETSKRTAIEIMNTLHEDDFFNILPFKNEVTFLDPSISGMLVRATDAIKRRFVSLLQKIPTADFANYTVALPVAFELLRQPGKVHSSNCNKAIMIISDTAPDPFNEIIDAYNPERDIRIFTYVIGREITEYEYMARLACNSRGFVGHVVTLADIKGYVEEYYQVLGRPMVLMRNHSNIWTGAHWHPRNSLGRVITMAQPVFNRSAEAGLKGSLIGVMGLDISVDEFIKPLHPHQWGVGSYAFGINHNGQVIFHPGWKAVLTKYGLRKPVHEQVDLSDVEREVPAGNETSDGIIDASLHTGFSKNQVRQEMIDQITGRYRTRILRVVENGNRVYERDYQYTYAGVEHSPFSIALATPVGLERLYSQRLQVHGVRRPRETDGPLFGGSEWTLHPEWFYCNVTLAAYPNPRQLLRQIFSRDQTFGHEIPLTCDRDFIESVIFDAKATHFVTSSWSNQPSSPMADIVDLYGITTVFVSTRSGLTMWKDYSPVEFFDHVDEAECHPSRADPMYYIDDADNGTCIFKRHLMEIYSRASEEPYYERTVTSGAALTVTIGIQTSSIKDLQLNADLIMVSVPVFVTDEKKRTAPVAVSGMIMTTSSLRDLIRQISLETCNGVESCFSCHSGLATCYLLDENSYIVVDTKYPENTGKLFGAVHGGVMRSLLDRKIFNMYNITDAQGLCHHPPKHKNSAARDLSLWVLSALKSLFSVGTFWFRYLLFGMVSASDEYYNFDWRDENDTNPYPPPQPPPYLCESQYNLFLNVWDDSRAMYQLECSSNCTKNVAVVKVLLSNMILVALDTPRSCPCNDARFTIEPHELRYTPEEVHHRFLDEKYRKPPGDCFSYFKDEDSSHCFRPNDPYLEFFEQNEASIVPTHVFLLSLLCALTSLISINIAM